MSATTRAQSVQESLIRLLDKTGISENAGPYLTFTICLVGVLLCSYFAFIVGRKLSRVLIHRLAKRINYPVDEIARRNKVSGRVALLAAVLVFAAGVPYLMVSWTDGLPLAIKVMEILGIVAVGALIHALLKTTRDALQNTETFRDKPLTSYQQVISMGLFFVAGMAVFSRLTGVSVLAFLTAMGAASAVLLIVFKDSILGFVASIQVTTNDMVRIGDWIEMPKYNADGDVIAITINTVKVQNWDKTITTIPTYALIADSFRNWRGMQHSGGRRIKRSIHIKLASIRFLDAEELGTMARVERIQEYISSRQNEIHQHNLKYDTDKTLLLNGRGLTNIGLFRKYVEVYLAENKMLNQEMTCMVRQLQPTEKGLPIEIYAFARDTRWVYYEKVMADIFDHLLAAVTYFDLSVHEAPASDDVQRLVATL